MNKTIFFSGMSIISASLSLFSGCNSKPADEQSKSAVSAAQDKNNLKQSLRMANDQFYAALNSMFLGDIAPINAIWSHGDDVTYMGPFGGCLVGWNDVGAEFKKVADIKLGGKIECNDLILYAGSDMGYSICTELGVNMSADGKPVMVSHRATNIFRLENGQWKLLHHHTDLSPQLQQARATYGK